MCKKIIALFLSSLLLGCTHSKDHYIKEVSLKFGNLLYEYSISNPYWYDQFAEDILETDPEVINETSDIYNAYLYEIEQNVKDIADDSGLEEITEYLTRTRLHREKEIVEFIDLVEYESSYESSIKVTGSHYVLKFNISFLKTTPKPLITGFKVTTLEFINPE